MKPVSKGQPPRKYKTYGAYKKHLIDNIGCQCSYCEAPGDAKSLDVEHIYPKAHHPTLKTSWSNFLLSCKTCNSYKNIHLGKLPQKNLKSQYLWPHIDNTFNAFKYSANGNVTITQPIPQSTETLNMLGLIKSPAKAKGYRKIGIAYDGTSLRKEAWGMATTALNSYIQNPAPANLDYIKKSATKIGYFSIWMEVFHAHPAARLEFIKEFKADSTCFNAATQPLKKGRI